MDVPPKTVGRYEIRREIGRGMMGVVYEALDPALARTIALKTIEISFAVGTGETEAFEQRFFAEAQIAARLSHPGIVVVHDVGRDPETGTLYIAMEWLRGRTLADLVRDGVRFDWRQALSIVLRIAQALHHAHTQGVIHRDLKPANIILLPSGEPKILDFGIAKADTSRIKVTSDGQFFGTPLYMSPEQALGHDIDARSDLFALGAVAYNLLTGQAAFAAPTVPEILKHVIEDDPPPPSLVVPGLPAGVDALLSRALAKEPSARYPDGESMAEDVKEILGGRAPHEVAVAPVVPVAGPAPSLAAAHPLEQLEKLEPASMTPLEPMAAAPPPSASQEPLPIAAPPAPLAPPIAPPEPTPIAGPSVQVHEVGAATRPGGDMRAEIDTLFQGLTPLDGEGPSPPPAVGPASASGAASARPVAPPVPRKRARPWALPLAALLVIGVGAWLLWPKAAPAPTPSPEGASSPPRAVATPVEEATATASAEPREAAGSTLAVDFEHPLKDGTLRLWVDGELAVDQDLAARTRKVVGIKLHKGSLEKTIPVRPGRRTVRVRVLWDDNLKEETLITTFKPGQTRLLEIRLGRIRKNLSVDWK